jgi:hypothetical protein
MKFGSNAFLLIMKSVIICLVLIKSSNGMSLETYEITQPEKEMTLENYEESLIEEIVRDELDIIDHLKKLKAIKLQKETSPEEILIKENKR